MNVYRLRALAVLAMVGAAVVRCAAQDVEVTHTSGTSTAPTYLFSHPFQPRWCPPSPSVPMPAPSDPSKPKLPSPGDLKTPNTPETPQTPQTPNNLQDALSGAGEYKSSPGQMSSVFAGTGLGAAASGDPTFTNVFTPVVLPGLFTAGNSQSAIPIDRIYFDYGYFSGVNVSGVGANAPFIVKTPVIIPPQPPPSSPSTSLPFIPVTAQGTPATFHSNVSQVGGPVPGFNLHSFNVGIEKTFFDGVASVYVTFPFLLATDNITGQDIDGLGDISAGFKVILYQNLQTRTTLTAGLTVSFPTAHAGVSTSFVQTGAGMGDSLVPASTTTINPTYFQPWMAGLAVFDRLWAHEYFGIVIPTDNRVATFLNSDFTLGYQLYRAEGRLLSSITPTICAEVLIPVTHTGSTPEGQLDTTLVPFNGQALPTPPPPTNFTFPAEAFLTAGAQFGIGDRCMISAGIVIPITGPRGYSVGGVFGLNYFY